MEAGPFLLTPAGAVSTAAVLTVLVLVETLFSPTAPFFILYAILALAIPLAVRQAPFGPFREAFRGTGWRTAGTFLAVLGVDVLLTGIVYDQILAGAHLEREPFYSLNAAITALLDQAGARLGIAAQAAQVLFAGYLVFWAPIGEELFYRGYLYGVLAGRLSHRSAALVSSAFFGLRHATHLFYLWPSVPLVAALVWVVDTFVIGLLLASLFQRTRSLWPPFLVHVLVNLVGVGLSAAA